jgi:CheY-like chemotaxis protein
MPTPPTPSRSCCGSRGTKRKPCIPPPRPWSSSTPYHPDIALLDIGLPEMDGFELVRRLRERPALVGVKFVALTGYGQIEDRRRVRESGFDDHLIKPIDLDALDRIFRGVSRGR